MSIHLENAVRFIQRALFGRKGFRGLLRDRRGANMVEYVVVLGVVSLMALGPFRIFGQTVSDKVLEQVAKISTI